MIKQERVSALAIATVVSLALFLSASAALAESVPQAKCGRGDHTESGLQGQTHRKNVLAAIPNAATTATWNSCPVPR